MTGADRRRSPRVEVLLKVDYLDPAGLCDYITNLGEGGLFIRTQAEFMIGQTILFTLSFPDLLSPLELEGVVRWRTPASAVERGVGVELRYRDEAQRQQIRSLLAAVNRPPARPASQPFRVLLVEDSAFARELYDYAIRKTLTEREGELEVYWAADGLEARALLERTRFDLAVVDHVLPGMSGCDLVREMRQREETRGIPVLVVSGAGDEARRLAVESGADMFLDKPVVHKQLTETLLSLLARRREQTGGPR